MKRISGLMLVASLLTACEFHTEPYWDNVCVESHIEMMMMPTYINNQMYMQMQPVDECDKYQTQCIVPKKYEGKPLCPPINEKEIIP